MTNFIAKATANAHGQFRAKAQRAGETTLEYAHEHDKGNSKTAKQARLAETLIGMHHHAADKLYKGGNHTSKGS